MLLTPADIEKATTELSGVVRRTPMVASRVLSERSGADVLLKCENLQRTGSFKPRGAYLRISRLTAEERARGERRQSRAGCRLVGDRAGDHRTRVHADRRVVAEDRGDESLWRRSGSGR
ncbi:threonine dehydratase [Gordonia alkanivorans NBRC 16433]|uniref:Threonine dehydratase n=1 Tax=Gordonia alkanivorans NBRC 16433 TaxID=1027371 RepID=F9VSE4_9ACTN|nr:threonine dehydratase [Gordonia alkanivorans NBRC 16433]